MQFIILLALLLSVTAWLVRSYHQLEQLRILTSSNWQLVLASLHRRNVALRELIYKLSSHNGQDMLLRRLRHAQGDLELSISSSKASSQPWEQLHQIERNESILKQLFAELTLSTQSAHELEQSFQELKHLDLIRQQSIMQYNASVLVYQKRRMLTPFRQMSQLAQVPDIATLDAKELLH